MNTSSHLLNEDRGDYERILDETLRAAHRHPQLAAVGQRLTREQLRTMALNATSLITAAAATEYEHYVRVREELRAPASDAARSVPPRSDIPRMGTGRAARAGLGRRVGAAVLGSTRPGSRRADGGVAVQRWAGMSYGRRLLAALLGLRVRPEAPKEGEASAPRMSAPRMFEPRTAVASVGARADRGGTGVWDVTENAGPGLFAVFAVLAPVLSGAAAAILLGIGFGLRIFRADSAFAQAMITTGWLFGAVTMASVLVGAVALVVTALRHQPTGQTRGSHETSEELTRAREAWREALLERGIVPFLRDALADPAAAPSPSRTPSAPVGRMGLVGYGYPGPTAAPDEGSGPAPRPRPRYTSPDYTSPDFGGPEHQPE